VLDYQLIINRGGGNSDKESTRELTMEMPEKERPRQETEKKNPIKLKTGKKKDIGIYPVKHLSLNNPEEKKKRNV